MKEQIKEYQKQLEKGIGYYMESPVNERISEAVDQMARCWLSLEKVSKKMKDSCSLTMEEAKCWNECMKNADGTDGGHWTIEQTTGVADSIGLKFEHIADYEWNVTMNMMYSDYYGVAELMGINSPRFYAEMSKAFLFDEDAKPPKEKLYSYYEYIVK